MDRTLRIPWFPGVVLLLLCALPSRVDAQHFVCWPIAAGDTASSLARRLTGNAAAAYGFAFQIRDPARRMFVPKSRYQRLESDWQACVARGPVPNNLIAYAPVVELAESAAVAGEPTIAPPPQAPTSAPLLLAHAARTLTDVPYAAPIGAAVLLIIVLSATASFVAPRPIPPSVWRAGKDFVTVFARPLVDPSSDVPPIEAKLRFRRRKQRLEISIAPGPGRRYPNLADHKKNVEYDVNRVIRVLGNYVLCSPPRAAGKWVVVTICPGTPGTSSPDPSLARSLDSAPVTGIEPSLGSHREAHSLTARAPFQRGRS
ncbi:MAG TPA: hypothetical protein VJN96_13410 [Vicinamibacterales bacterium]|nr:hypothetical protein [Vicinamibacterales bacterium]